MALLATSLLVVRSYDRLADVNLGLEPDHTIQLFTFFSAPSYPARPQQLAAANRLLRAIRSVPGVQAAAEDWSPVLEGDRWSGRVAEGDGKTHGKLHNVQLRFITPEYFRVLGVKPILGRLFAPHSDDAGSAVMVNKAFVRKFLLTSRPLSLNLYGGNWKLAPLGAIVGVIPNIREVAANAAPQPTVYIDFPDIPSKPSALYGGYLVRQEPGHDLSAATLERVVRGTVPNVPVLEAKTLQHDLADECAPLRLRSLSLLALAGLVTLLGLAGIYSTTRLWMNQRAFEFAVRAALGATPRDILHLALRRNLAAALSGIVCGAAVALAVGRGTAAFLFGISPYDPTTLALSAVALAAASLLAIYMAASRLARRAPATILRAN